MKKTQSRLVLLLRGIICILYAITRSSTAASDSNSILLLGVSPEGQLLVLLLLLLLYLLSLWFNSIQYQFCCMLMIIQLMFGLQMRIIIWGCCHPLLLWVPSNVKTDPRNSPNLSSMTISATAQTPLTSLVLPILIFHCSRLKYGRNCSPSLPTFSLSLSPLFGSLHQKQVVIDVVFVL